MKPQSLGVCDTLAESSVAGALVCWEQRRRTRDRREASRLARELESPTRMRGELGVRQGRTCSKFARTARIGLSI